MGNTSNIRAGGAFVEIGANDAPLNAALARVIAKFRSFATLTATIGKDLIKVGGAMIAPFLIASKAFSDMGSSLYRASQRTGVSVESLSLLSYAAVQVGIDMETLEGGIKKMQKAIVGSDAVLGELGLTMDDLKGKSPEEQFKLIADAMNKIQDPTVRAGEALKVFGKGGTDLLPLLADGSAGIEMYEKRARALGLTIGSETARAAVVLRGRIEDLTDVFKHIIFEVGGVGAPVFQKFAETLTQGVISVTRWLEAHKELTKNALEMGRGIFKVGIAIFAIGEAINFIGATMPGLASAFSLVRSAIGYVVPVLFGMLNPIGLVIAGVGALAAYLLYATTTGRDMLTALGDYFSGLKDTALAAFGGIRDAIAAGDWALAADIAFAGLKLAWVQGIAPLKAIWTNFKHWALTLWENVADGISKAVLRATGFFRETWAKAVAFYENLTTDLGDSMVRLWIAAQEKMGKITANEAEAQRTQLKQLNKQAHDNTDNEKNATLANIEAETKAELAALDVIHKAEMQRLETATDAERKAAEDNYKQKKADLITLMEQAAVERAQGGKGGLPALPELKDRPNSPNAADYDRLMKMTTEGTFSAAGAFGLSAGVSAQHLAEAKKQSKQLDTLIKATLAAPMAKFG